VIDADFYALNAARGYPFEDAATRLDAAGGRLPAGFLVDCSLRFPASAGRFAFVSSASATATLATLTFEASPAPARRSLLAGPAPPAPFRPLGSVAVRAPFPVHEPIPIEPEAEGVAGWVVLGPGVLSPYSGTFDGTGRSGLLFRCARPAPDPPVRSIRSGRADAGLAGLVALLGGADVRVYANSQVVGGRSRTVVQVGLHRPGTPRRELLAAYAGPCGARPESGTCDPPAVESLGGAVPDADGDVQIAFDPAFEGLAAYPLAGSAGGIVFDLPRTLDDVCPPPGAPSASGAVAAEAAAGSRACGDRYDFPDPDWDLEVAAGVFAMNASGCEAAAGPAAAGRARSPSPSRVRAVFALPPGDPGPDPEPGRWAAGVAFDYAPGEGGGPPSYRTAIVDLAAGTLAISRVDGSGTAVEASASFVPAVGPEWYPGTQVEVAVTIGGPGEGGVRRVVFEARTALESASTAFDAPAGGGGFGVAAGGAGPAFKSLEAED